MRYLLFVLVVLAAVLPAKAQYYFTDTAAVNTAYRELMKDPENPDKQLQFVKMFPRNWHEYINFYYIPIERISDPEVDMTMHNRSYEHINTLVERTGQVADSLVCEKIVNIAIIVPYDVDEFAYIYGGVHRLLQTRRDAMFKTIVNLTEPDQLRFWLFTCACPTNSDSRKKRLDEIYESFRAEYPEEAKTMRIGYDYAFNKTLMDGEGHIGKRKYQPNINPLGL